MPTDWTNWADGGPTARPDAAAWTNETVTSAVVPATADLSLPLNGWTAASGLTFNLPAGTYMLHLIADLQAQAGAGGFTVAVAMARMVVNSVVQTGLAIAQAYNGQIVRATASQVWKVTLGSTQSIQVQGGYTDTSGGGSGFLESDNTRLIWEKIPT